MVGYSSSWIAAHERQQRSQQQSNAMLGPTNLPLFGQQQFGAAIGRIYPGTIDGLGDYAQPTTEPPKKLSFIKRLQEETDEWLKGVVD